MVQLTGGLQVCTLVKEEEVSKNAKGIYLVLIISIDERLACLEWVYRNTLPRKATHSNCPQLQGSNLFAIFAPSQFCMVEMFYVVLNLFLQSALNLLAGQITWWFSLRARQELKENKP